MSIIKNKGNKVLKAGIGYTVGNYLLKGINFLTVPIFTRLMSTADYGTYNIYISYDAIVTVFIGLALQSSLKNAKYEYKNKFNEYISSILIIPLIVLGVLLAVLNIFGDHFQNLLDLNRVALNILLFHSFANSILQLYNNKLGLDYKYKDFLKVSFINTFANIALSISLMYSIYVNERYMGRIVGSALPMVLIAIYVYILSIKEAKPHISKKYWKYGLSYSLPIVPHSLSQIILSSFDRIMIKSLVGNSEAGVYSLGVSIEGLVKVTTTSLDTVWGPWFYEKMEAKDYKAIKKCSSYYSYGMFVFLGCLMIAGPEIVRIMGPDSYQDAKFVVVPLLCCTYFTFLYTIPATVEYYYKKTSLIALGTMGAALLNVVLNYFFIKNYGYQAAAYTTLISYMAYFVFHFIIAKRVAKMQLFSVKTILACIFGSFIICGFSLCFIDMFWIRLIVGLTFLMINVLFIRLKLWPELRAFR